MMGVVFDVVKALAIYFIYYMIYEYYVKGTCMLLIIMQGYTLITSWLMG